MARITPATGNTMDLTKLEDHERYTATLKAWEWTTSSAEYGSEKRLQIDWEMEDGQSLRDWLSLKLGKQQNGQVSKLRALLNALSQRPDISDVAWFDDETAEWSYDGDHVDNKLVPGMQVDFRGKTGAKADGTPKFGITVYQSVRSAGSSGTSSPTTATTPLGRPASAPGREGPIPF